MGQENSPSIVNDGSRTLLRMAFVFYGLLFLLPVYSIFTLFAANEVFYVYDIAGTTGIILILVGMGSVGYASLRVKDPTTLSILAIISMVPMGFVMSMVFTARSMEEFYILTSLGFGTVLAVFGMILALIAAFVANSPNTPKQNIATQGMYNRQPVQNQEGYLQPINQQQPVTQTQLPQQQPVTQAQPPQQQPTGLAEEKIPMKYCQTCGSKNDGSVFCSNCGSKL